MLRTDDLGGTETMDAKAAVPRESAIQSQVPARARLPPDIEKRLSPSVAGLLSRSPDYPVIAAELAAQVLQAHPEYGVSGANKAIEQLYMLAKKTSDGVRHTEAAWIERIAEIYDKEATITGRCVIVGLALLDTAARDVLLDGDFLSRVAAEAPDGHAPAVERLLPRQQRQVRGWIEKWSGATRILSDQPAGQDDLDRMPFAKSIADRIRYLRSDDTESLIVIHLDGIWGSGKSTILNFLRNALGTSRAPSENVPSERAAKSRHNVWQRRRTKSRTKNAWDRWLIIDYNAWQQQRLTEPWWTLSALLAREGCRDAWRSRRLFSWARIRLSDAWFQSVNSKIVIVVATALLLICAAYEVLLLLVNLPGFLKEFGLSSEHLTMAAIWVEKTLGSLPNVKAVSDFLNAIPIQLLTWSAVAAIFTIANQLLQLLRSSGQSFLQSRLDPFGALVAHVGRLLKHIRRPVIVLVDDIDRCNRDAVVSLLEGIHTVFGALPVTFVVAGDGRWIANAFDKAYADDKTGHASPDAAVGKSLGMLFLEKLFQFSASVPEMSESVKARYWSSLLKTSSEAPADARNSKRKSEETNRQVNDINTLKTEEEILDALRKTDDRLDAELARQLREAAISRLAQPELIDQPSRHILQLLAPIVEPNPRAMKRHVMAYGIDRAADLAMHNLTEQPLLVAWSCFKLRWPLLAEWLREDPARADLIVRRTNETETPTDAEMLRLLRHIRHDERRKIGDFIKGTAAPELPALDAVAIARITGRAQGS